MDIIFDDEFVTFKDGGFIVFLSNGMIVWILKLLGYMRMVFDIWNLRCWIPRE